MKLIRDILGEDMWKKGVFVLTYANELKFNIPDKEKEFNDKLNEWERELKEKIEEKKIIDPEIAEKIPIVPAGCKEPELPDRLSWISELWIQGFRRMGFRAMVKLLLINQKRIQGSRSTNNRKSKDMNLENQPLFTCHMTMEESLKFVSAKQVRAAGQAVGAILIGTATLFMPLSVEFVGAGMMGGSYLGNATVNWVLNRKVTDIDCIEKVIFSSLIKTFMEEYPEYDYKSQKDEL